MNTTELLSAIKRSITIPTYQARFSDQDILDLANEEQISTIVPIVTSLQEEFFCIFEPTTVPLGSEKIQIPERAAGRNLREIHYKTDQSVYNLPRFQVTESFRWSQYTTGNPSGFYILGDYIYLVPVPQSDGILNLYYPMNPNKLVEVDNTNTISSVTNDTVGNNYYVTVSSAIATGIAIGSLVDITQYKAGYSVLYKDLTVINKSSRDIYLSNPVTAFSATNLITGVNALDSISLAQETSIVQLPNEATQCLIQATAVRVLEALAIPEQLRIAMDVYARKVAACQRALAPRVDGEGQKIVNRNGLLRGRYNTRRFPSIRV